MHPFTSITSGIVPLNRSDVDTDQIIPAQYLTGTGRGGYGKGLFERLRQQDPDFVLNDTHYKDAQILVAGTNFGCGSSREHAVWALMEWGFRVVIAPSFADIFHSNAGKNGLVTVVLGEDVVREILINQSVMVSLPLDHELGVEWSNHEKDNDVVLRQAQDDMKNAIDRGKYQISVNLEKQLVTLHDGTEHHFDYDPFRKDCIFKGLDDLDYVLSQKSEIENWQEERQKELFFKTTEANRAA